MNKIIQGIKNIAIAFILAEKFRKRMLSVIRAEQSNPDLFPQKIYTSCRERASDMIGNAIEPVITFYGLCIAEHRESAHGDDVSDEKKALAEESTAADVKISTLAWWRS